MDVSSSTNSIIADYLSQREAANQNDVQVALLKKAQNQMKLEGALMIQLLDPATPQVSAAQAPLALLDVYA